MQLYLGNIENINSSIFSSAESTVSLMLTLLGSICLWNGIMKIAINSSLVDIICKVISPIMKIVFPEIKKDDKEHKEISLNIASNMLGLGNAATPMGLKAMQTMQEKNEKKDTLSNSMFMFIIINCASIQIIPTTVMAIRSSLNSKSPSMIIVPVWIVTISVAIISIIIGKILMKKTEKK